MLTEWQFNRASSFLRQLKAVAAKFTDPDERQFHACLVLVVSAAVMGTDIKVLAKNTGYGMRLLKSVSSRMRAASLWIGPLADVSEWGDNESHFMFAVFAQASVARGTSVREIDATGHVGYPDRV